MNTVRESALHHEQCIRVYPRFSEQNALCTPAERQVNRWEMSVAQDNIDYIVAEDTVKRCKHSSQLLSSVMNVAFEHICRMILEG